MDHRIHQIPNRFALDFPSVKEKPQAAETEFREIFQKELSLKISKHASERLEERNIHIDKKQWHLIEDKMNEARRKG
ncbi:MAG TPA: flagellar protein, partial [Bacillota bacterium]|nr:flagellar protein [Bacillota bacterium]